MSHVFSRDLYLLLLTEQNRPWDIWRKRDRMLSSAINFALGFFGWPLDGKYEQVIMIEASGVSPVS